VHQHLGVVVSFHPDIVVRAIKFVDEKNIMLLIEADGNFTAIPYMRS
jgi:hypothetical protein